MDAPGATQIWTCAQIGPCREGLHWISRTPSQQLNSESPPTYPSLPAVAALASASCPLSAELAGGHAAEPPQITHIMSPPQLIFPPNFKQYVSFKEYIPNQSFRCTFIILSHMQRRGPST